MATVLIIGASRGIGLEFVRQYRAQQDTVFATVRSDSARQPVEALGAKAVVLDVRDLTTAPSPVLAALPQQIDLCIYVAGQLGPRSEKVEAPDVETFDAVMHTNVLGALALIPQIAPRIATGGKIVFLSSRMGSIGLMQSASAILYRASKAALNAVVKGASLEWGPRGVTMVMMHPGWVRTDMGGTGADLTVDASVSGMRAVIEGAQNGHFYDYAGTELAW